MNGEFVIFTSVGLLIVVFIVCMVIDFLYKWKVRKSIISLQGELVKMNECESDCVVRIRKREKVGEIRELIHEGKLDRESKIKEMGWKSS